MSDEGEFDCGEDCLEEESLCDYTGEECCGDKMFCEECIVMVGLMEGEKGMNVSEVCRGLDCSKCPIRDSACLVLEEQIEQEMKSGKVTEEDPERDPEVDPEEYPEEPE